MKNVKKYCIVIALFMSKSTVMWCADNEVKELLPQAIEQSQLPQSVRPLSGTQPEQGERKNRCGITDKERMVFAASCVMGAAVG